jgi:hypothetical protein
MRRVLLLAGLVFAALPAGSALADTTIGKTGGDPGSGCFGGVLVGDTNYVVPSGGGTITSFSFQSTPANTGEQLDFVVLRPEPVGRGLVVGKTGLVTLKERASRRFRPTSLSRAATSCFWSFALDNCFRAVGLTRLVVAHASDPDTGQLFAVRSGDKADLNESANLATGVGGPPPPTTKAQCKHGGWKDFPQFKNQGQCVRFVNDHQKKHHHKHHPGGSPARVWGS